MKPVIWFVIVGVLCVILTEILSVFVMTVLPPSIDVVGNLIAFVVAPVIVVLSLVGAFLLTKKLRAVSFARSLLFPLSFAGLQFVLLMAMGNPVGYCLTLLAVTYTASVLAVLWRRSTG